MQYSFRLLLLLIPVLVDAQTFPISVTVDPGIVVNMVVRDLEGTTQDTFLHIPEIKENFSGQIVLPDIYTSNAIRPLLFSFSEPNGTFVSGLMISDTTHFRIKRSEGRLSAIQVLTKPNEWFADMTDPKNTVITRLLEKNQDAQRQVIADLATNVTPQNAQIKALLFHAFLLRDAFSVDQYGQIISILEGMSEGTWSNRTLDLLRQRLRQTQELENFRFDVYGENPGELNALLNKDYVLLDFWASWCGPCITGMKHLKFEWPSLQKNANILSLSTDSTPEAWKKASSKLQLPWPSAYDSAPLEQKIQTRLGITAIPYYIVIDKNRQILFRGNELDKALQIINQ